SAVHIEDSQSPFKKTVRMILCIHGWDGPEHSQAMSLMVFHFHLSCNKENARYSSARIWFTFGEHIAGNSDDAGDTEDAEAIPEVVSWAPLDKSIDSS